MNSNSDNIFVGDCDHSKSQDPLDYRLRVTTKRTDLPDDVIRLLAEAYSEIIFLEKRNKNLKEGFEGGCHLCEVVAENSNRIRDSYNAAWKFNEELEKKNAELEKERDNSYLEKDRIMNEIDCRIEHGADSNGHLEAIRNLFGKKNG